MNKREIYTEAYRLERQLTRLGSHPIMMDLSSVIRKQLKKLQALDYRTCMIAARTLHWRGSRFIGRSIMDESGDYAIKRVGYVLPAVGIMYRDGYPEEKLIGLYEHLEWPRFGDWQKKVDGKWVSVGKCEICNDRQIRKTVDGVQVCDKCWVTGKASIRREAAPSDR